MQAGVMEYWNTGRLEYWVDKINAMFAD